MTKREIRNADTGALITETIHTYGLIMRNCVSDRGTKQLNSHFDDCCNELINRGLITNDNIEFLNR